MYATPCIVLLNIQVLEAQISLRILSLTEMTTLFSVKNKKKNKRCLLLFLVSGLMFWFLEVK